MLSGIYIVSSDVAAVGSRQNISSLCEGESSDISVWVSPVSASLVQFDRVSSE